ncbi:MAG: dipeptide epimerase [Elusimicrobiota bacterium]
MTGDRITRLTARLLNAPLRESFEIATGGQARAANVLVELRLADGTRGYGECAPFPDFNGETQTRTLRAVRAQAGLLTGRRAASAGALAKELAERLPRCGAARAGLEMALLDAWSRCRHFPLRVFFGGAETRLATDITIPITPSEHARRSARRHARCGINTLKIKIGRDADEDLERIAAVRDGHPRARLLLDANGGYDADGALRLLRRLSRLGIRPALFEQPVPREDLAGLRIVSRRIPVAADESASSLRDVLRLARRKAVQVVNIKPMKCGLFESLDIARTARAAGMKLMIGGLVESRLAMTCSAHFAAGLGGFSFVDLDTPLFFTRDPMRGVPIRRGGVYDLSRVRAGIGVVPK